MEQNSFFKPRDGVKLSELAQYLGAELPDASKADVIIRSVAPGQPGPSG